MKSLKGTKTAENLLKAFAGESQARNRYTYYASVARKEGYVQISNIFLETADHEKEHAKRFFKFLNESLNGEMVEINNASYPVALGDTKANLLAAAQGETKNGHPCILSLQGWRMKKDSSNSQKYSEEFL